MSLGKLVLRSLVFYWRTNIAVVFGLAVAAAVITGSLVIGDSVQGSLRDTALSRLGRIEYALTAPRYFRQALGADLAGHPTLANAADTVCPIVSTTGAARDAQSGSIVPDVAVLGVDDQFWQLYDAPSISLSGRECAINQALADDLGVAANDSIVVTAHKQAAIATDSLFARRGRKDTAPSLRVKVASVLPAGGAGDFRLDAQNATPRNLFISRDWLAERLSRSDQANVLLVASSDSAQGDISDGLDKAMASVCTLADYGLKLSTDEQQRYVSLSSDAMTLADKPYENAAYAVASSLGADYQIASVYLATTISKVGGTGRDVPYSMIASTVPSVGYKFISGGGSFPGQDGIWLSTWAAEDLQARVGDDVRVEFLVPTDDGSYPTQSIALRVRGIVEMSGSAADRGIVPPFEGITDAARIDEWDPPFFVDLDRITKRDDDYWAQYGPTPKAFVGMETVARMWQSAPGSEKADYLTSVRTHPLEGESLGALKQEFETKLVAQLDPKDAGLSFRPVRNLALYASKGSSDFGQLFLGLSMFLVFSGAGLAGMLMRLSVDRRASEAGIMLACGLRGPVVKRALAAEGILMSVAGTAAGVPLGVLYAAWLINALSTSWQGALGDTSHLWLHVTAQSVAIGAVSGLFVGLVTVLWSTRRLGKRRVLELLAGWQAMAAVSMDPRRRAMVVMVLALIGAAALGVLVGVTHTIEPAGAFFGIGAALLVAVLAGASVLLSVLLRSAHAGRSLGGLALRSAAANSARSLLVLGLLATATFVVVAVAANTRDFSQMDYSDKASGTGGFELLATSSVPLSYDPATRKGRENLGFSEEDEKALEGTQIVSFLMSPGEDISCLNIARPTQPRLLGVPDEMIQRGGFSPLVGKTGQSNAPWKGLLDDLGSITPAFGDADSVKWTLHSGLGQVYVMPVDPAGLKFVGLTPGSIFQRELLVSEDNLRSIYPAVTAPSYFLIDTPAGREDQVAQTLRKNLGELGLKVRSTREVLNEFMQVQNTYLSMFLALGGLGLLLGTVGMVTVLLRSAMERRGELALLTATGFDRPRVARLLLIENGALLLAGLGSGTVTALVAVAPQLASAHARVDWASLLALLLAILATGVLTCVFAVEATVRGNLIAALREE